MPPDSKNAASGPGAPGRPFSLTDREFEKIRRLVKAKTGISLGLHKRDLVISRLAKRLRALGLESFSQYLEILHGDGAGEELINMINQITTNKTEFFREPHHFDYLKQTILPALVDQGERSGQPKVRIWSAGCSSGEEPYTIALVLREFFAKLRGWDLQILATDLDTNMLHRASQGVYPASITKAVTRDLLARYFVRQRDQDGDTYAVKPDLRDMITFRQFNLMSPTYPLKPALDMIFCRNVMIYFENQDKTDMIAKFHHLLKPGGHLFVGHSESLMMAKHLFARQTSTVYLKI